MLAALKAGTFATRERVRVYSIPLLIAYIVAAAALLATSDGIVDRAGRPLGTDFANVYSAGVLALQGEPAKVYDWPAQHAVQKAISGRSEIPFFPWHYPPAFLLVAAMLATLPYLAALFVYQAVTFVAYLGVVQRIAGRPEAWLAAAAFPAVFVNATHGHNGYLTAALLGAALAVFHARPLLAGTLLGCLSYKPQLAALIPLALIAGGYWRQLAAAAGSATALVGIAWLAFGSETFLAFWHSLPLAQKVVLDGGPGFYKVQSVYAALRLLGVPIAFANAVQIATTAGVGVLLFAVWRSAAAFELKAAALAIACLLATPYLLDYDLVLLAPVIAFLVAHGLREGFAPYEVLMLAALWVLPLAARPLAHLTAISLGPIVMLAAFTLIVQRAGVLQRAAAGLAARGR